MFGHLTALVESSTGDGEEELVAGGIGEAVIRGGVAGVAFASELRSQYSVDVRSDHSRRVDILIEVLTRNRITFAVHVVQRQRSILALHDNHVRLSLKRRMNNVLEEDNRSRNHHCAGARETDSSPPVGRRPRLNREFDLIRVVQIIPRYTVVAVAATSRPAPVSVAHIADHLYNS